MFSINRQIQLVCASSGMALFASITAILAAGDGISPSMVPSVRFRPRLMVLSTWGMEMAARKICTVCDKSKECVKQSTRVLCVWDSGLVTVLVTDLLTHTLVGTQCPGFTWRKYHPHRLKLKLPNKIRVKVQIRFKGSIKAINEGQALAGSQKLQSCHCDFCAASKKIWF